MSIDIIKKLDQAYAHNPDPDYIARILNNNGWVNASYFTEDNLIEWNQKIVAVCYKDNFGRWVLSGKNYRFEWSLQILARSDFQEYYFIPRTDYREGQYPCDD